MTYLRINLTAIFVNLGPGCSTLLAKRQCPTGFLCGWPVGVEFFAGLLARSCCCGEIRLENILILLWSLRISAYSALKVSRLCAIYYVDNDIDQGRNHGWKVEGGQGLGPKGRLGVWCGRGSPLPLWGSGGITPWKFLETQMLNPAFWWLYLLWNFLLFENYGQNVGGPIHCWSPTNKLGDQSLPVSTVVAPITLTLTDRQTDTDTQRHGEKNNINRRVFYLSHAT